jgi:DNA-binding LacI/PurR family transcriptional regulator
VAGSRGHRPTLEEVAARAGVSRGTASRVVNRQAGVSPHAEQVVRKAVTELGYVPNRAAQALVARRSDAMGVVFAYTREGLLGHDVFARVVTGVHRVADAADVQMVLLVWETDDDRPGIERFLTGGHVDGVVLVGLPTDDPLPGVLRAIGVEVVVGGRPSGEPVPGVAHIDVDNHGGALAAVGHLTGQGRRVVATVMGPQNTAAAADRAAGWRDGLAAAGLEHGDDLAEESDFTRDGGHRAMQALLRRRPDLDAVFVAGDSMAAGALAALRDAGRAVPGDVAVVGFDGSAEATRTHPPLSTVTQPLEQLGERLASALMSLLAQRRVSAPTLPTELIVRESSAPSPGPGPSAPRRTVGARG